MAWPELDQRGHGLARAGSEETCLGQGWARGDLPGPELGQGRHATAETRLFDLSPRGWSPSSGMASPLAAPGHKGIAGETLDLRSGTRCQRDQKQKTVV